MSAFDRYKAPEGTYGHIQWKGTDLCMDFTCECGNSEHIDGAFVYAVRCEVCGVTWGMNPYIRLERLNAAEVSEVENGTAVATKEED